MKNRFIYKSNQKINYKRPKSLGVSSNLDKNLSIVAQSLLVEALSTLFKEVN